MLAVGTTGANGLFATTFGSNLVENGTITVLLVDGFTGAVGVDIDSDDDGQIDNEPWAAVVDAVGVSDGGVDDRTYAGLAVLVADFDAGTQQVGGASRMPDGQDTGAATDWARNDFDGAGLACCIAAIAEPGEALNTPGTANSMAP